MSMTFSMNTLSFDSLKVLTRHGLSPCAAHIRCALLELNPTALGGFAQLTLWWWQPNTVMIPGHDVPMVLGEEEVPQYIGTREPAISAWFGEHLETTTLFELSQ
jgi:hypothetical protein